MGKVVYIVETVMVFSFLGVAFGVLFDFVSAFERALKIKWVTFALDLIMTVFASVVYGCVLIAYSNGSFKGWHFFLSAALFILYMLTFHRILFPMFCGIFIPVHKISKKFTNKLKNNEKSLKKLLHLGK